MHMNDNDTTLIPGHDTPLPDGKLQRIAGHERGRRTTGPGWPNPSGAPGRSPVANGGRCWPPTRTATAW